MTVKKTHSLARALDVAADLATTRSTEHVLVSEIAAMSRCSTATLYACFSSKEQLLFEAFEHGRSLWSAPAVEEEPGADALVALVDYFRRRAIYLGSDRLRGLVSILINQRQSRPRSWRTSFTDLDEMPAIIALVEAAMIDAQLWPGDARAVAYGMQAAVSYEPLMLGLLLGGRVDVDALLHDVLTPHVTPAGRATLERLLAGAPHGDSGAHPADVLLGAHAADPPSTPPLAGKGRH